MVAKRKTIPRPVYFETTIPVIRPCPRCRVWLAAGVSEGMHVQAEFVALDPVQRVLVTLMGLRMFALTRTGLVHLDDYRLQDSRFVTYYPEHRCGVSWASNLPGAGDTRPNVAQAHIPPY